MGNDARSPIDNPIVSAGEDVLGRADVARRFAKGLRELDLSAGLVVGVLGAWGSGKSSFVNLMREEFESEPKLAVVDFNPWMFSGAQQLVDVFFKELAVELRLENPSRFGAIADGLDEYGDVLSPISMIPGVGARWDRAFRSYQTARRWWKDRGAQPMRKKVADALGVLDQPVVVVIDDIDRLSTGEIRDIFKLVRLTASFPNVIYVLAFDRKRVELALEEVNVPGRAYLEKIVQLTFDLPGIPREKLRSQLLDALSPMVDDVENVRFDPDRWPDVFYEVVEPSL
ncbi:KAP family P-loop NTPase fold protein [Leifsonia poae]|uniref:KAP family P-loop NTPase fold protein n=1 Tax=Leifsonia poae TaxID=110933 RepID=UPI003D69FD88